MLDGRSVIPAVRFAVDAYVNFCRQKPWSVAVSSSLTELFAPDLMAKRLEAFKRHYGWVQPWGFDYFSRRLTKARVDAVYEWPVSILRDDAGAPQVMPLSGTAP